MVLNRDGRGKADIEVRLLGEEQTISVTSDADGFYRLSNLNWGEVRLQAIWSGGAASEYVMLTVPGSAEVDFRE